MLQSPTNRACTNSAHPFVLVHTTWNDLACFHQIQGFAWQALRRNGLRILGHVRPLRAFREQRRDSSTISGEDRRVGQDPAMRPPVRGPWSCRVLLGRHLSENVGHRRVLRNARHAFSRLHQMFHAETFLP